VGDTALVLLIDLLSSAHSKHSATQSAEPANKRRFLYVKVRPTSYLSIYRSVPSCTAGTQVDLLNQGKGLIAAPLARRPLHSADQSHRLPAVRVVQQLRSLPARQFHRASSLGYPMYKRRCQSFPLISFEETNDAVVRANFYWCLLVQCVMHSTCRFTVPLKALTSPPNHVKPSSEYA
jgi:hypothetical protein